MDTSFDNSSHHNGTDPSTWSRLKLGQMTVLTEKSVIIHIRKREKKIKNLLKWKIVVSLHSDD